MRTIFTAAALLVATLGHVLLAVTGAGLDKALVELPKCDNGLDGLHLYADAVYECMDELVKRSALQHSSMAAAAVAADENNNKMHCAASCQRSLSLAECYECVQAAVAAHDEYCTDAVQNATIVLGSCTVVHSTAAAAATLDPNANANALGPDANANDVAANGDGDDAENMANADGANLDTENPNTDNAASADVLIN